VLAYRRTENSKCRTVRRGIYYLTLHRSRSSPDLCLFGFVFLHRSIPASWLELHIFPRLNFIESAYTYRQFFNGSQDSDPYRASKCTSPPSLSPSWPSSPQLSATITIIPTTQPTTAQTIPNPPTRHPSTPPSNRSATRLRRRRFSSTRKIGVGWRRFIL
jgi:hypothetical protein